MRASPAGGLLGSMTRPDPSERPAPTGIRTRPPAWRSWVALGLLLAAVSVAQRAWQAWGTERAAATLARELAADELLLVSSQSCPHCLIARRWLQERGIAHRECVIEAEVACLQLYRALMAPGTPLVLVRGRVLIGFSPQAVAQALQR